MQPADTVGGSFILCSLPASPLNARFVRRSTADAYTDVQPTDDPAAGQPGCRDALQEPNRLPVENPADRVFGWYKGTYSYISLRLISSESQSIYARAPLGSTAHFL